MHDCTFKTAMIMTLAHIRESMCLNIKGKELQSITYRIIIYNMAQYELIEK